MSQRINLIADGNAVVNADPAMPLLYAAAIANAIFDATGVRIRRVPLTPERVKAALART